MTSQNVITANILDELMRLLAELNGIKKEEIQWSFKSEES